MKVGMYYNNSKVLVEEQQRPEISDDEILIRVNACGICGSDLMEWYRIKKAPLVLGHELAGDVVEVGRNITQFKVGDRVFSTHHVPCGQCTYCLTDHNTACVEFQTVNNHSPGGFSEYLKIKGRSLLTGTFILPESMSYEEATFIEPLGTVIRGLRTSEIQPGDDVAVLGSGIIGLLMIKAARALGAGRIIATDMNQYRLDAARRFGAEAVINASENIPETIKQINNGKLASKVILCTGACKAAETALECVDRGGILNFFAVPNPGEKLSIDFNPFWRNDVTIKTCYGAAPLDNLQAMEMIRTNAVVVDDMITHRFTLSEITEAFKTAGSGIDCLKVIVNP